MGIIFICIFLILIYHRWIDSAIIIKFVRFCHCLFNASFLALYLSFCICTSNQQKNNSRKANTSICEVQYQEIAAKPESTACWLKTGFKNKYGSWVSFYFIITNNIRWQTDNCKLSAATYKSSLCDFMILLFPVCPFFVILNLKIQFFRNVTSIELII